MHTPQPNVLYPCNASLKSLLIVVHEAFEHKTFNSKAAAGCQTAKFQFMQIRETSDTLREGGNGWLGGKKSGGVCGVKKVTTLGAENPHGVTLSRTECRYLRYVG